MSPHIPQKVIPRDVYIFYVIDTSASVGQDKVDSIIHSLSASMDELDEMESLDLRFWISVLTFGDAVRWLHPEPVRPMDFGDVSVTAGGVRKMKEAFRELKVKMSVSAFLKFSGRKTAPVVIFMSGGAPEDDCQSELDSLWENGWFEASVKLAVPICDDADKDVLGKFVGDPECIINEFDPVFIYRRVLGLGQLTPHIPYVPDEERPAFFNSEGWKLDDD